MSIGGARQPWITEVLAVWFGAALLGCSAESSPPIGTLSGSSPRLDPDSAGPIFSEDTSNAPPSGYFIGQACAEATLEPKLAGAALLFVVDTSGSMSEKAPGGSGSKWDVTRRAVLDAITGMSSETSVGLLFYPNRPRLGSFGSGTFVNLFSGPGLGPTCFDRRMRVGIEALGVAGSAQRQTIQRAFEQQQPEGGTPTHDAYRFALSQLQATTAPGPRFIVLITDGVPTFALGCQGTGRQEDPVDPTPLIAEAAVALDSGVGTFVIGSPGSEGARDSLSRMALAGGSSTGGCSPAGPNYCHFDLTRELDLGAGLDGALQSVSKQVSSCAFELPQPAPGSVIDAQKVNVFYSASGAQQELIARDADGPCDEGWRYTDDESQIRLCPSTCERVQAGQGRVSLQVGCITQVR